MQIDKLIIGIPVTLLLALGGSAAYYFMKHEFIARAEAEDVLDPIYLRQDTYQQSIQQQREWSLLDRINETKDRAAIENREPTPAELRQMERWGDELRKLSNEIIR
jgi:hypothetical protein